MVKNGIKMTGMPSFGKIEVPDPEIWSMVAFLKKLPSVSEDDYKAWTGAAQPPSRDGGIANRCFRAHLAIAA